MACYAESFTFTLPEGPKGTKAENLPESNGLKLL
jgi:hypothetical protein